MTQVSMSPVTGVEHQFKPVPKASDCLNSVTELLALFLLSLSLISELVRTEPVT